LRSSPGPACGQSWRRRRWRACRSAWAPSRWSSRPLAHRLLGASGGITAAYTLSFAVGGPLLGRLVDRRGARSVMAGVSTGSLIAGPLIEAFGWRLGVVAGIAGPTAMLPILAARRALHARA
jgi:MFS family permease